MTAKQSFGLFVAAIGVALGVMIVRHPENLRAPLWVALAAVGAFVAAGVVMFAEEAGARLARQFGLLCLLLALFAPPAWVAFGEGPRACSSGVGVGGVSMGGWTTSDIACRAGFGLGAVIAALMLVGFLLKWARGEAQ